MKASTNKKLYIVAAVLYFWLLVWVIVLKFNSYVVISDGHALATLPLLNRLGKNWIPFHSLKIDFAWDGIKQPLLNFIIYSPLVFL